MTGWQIGFEKPQFLWLLVLLLPLWLFSFRSLTGLGPYRRWFALGFRSLVLVLIALSLAEVQMKRVSDKVTVTYLLDQSESIPREQRQWMLEFVRQSVAEHRRVDREDCAGVIVFGREAVIEVPPFDDDIPLISLESVVGLRTDATNLAAALKMAHATFPEDSANRIVVVSDGNENLGDARAVARSLVEQGIGIDVVPVMLGRRGEVLVEKVTLPTDIRRGQPIEARVVLDNLTVPTPEHDGTVPGKLRLTRQMGQQQQLLNPDSQDVLLRPGKNVFSFSHTIDEVAAYRYQAVFVPDNPEDDLMPQNNQASAFTHVRGKGSVLVIEDAQNRGEVDHLVQRLRANNIEVSVQASDELFTNPAELLAFDSVILANVPRSTGTESDQVSSFSDEQIRMLVRNTEQFGCGLVMLGGPNSFGAGGWANTELEKAMPVDFQIRNQKVRAIGALVMVMHASEIAQGNHWQKVVAREAITPLGPMDYCGIIHWGMGGEQWLWGGAQGLVRVGDQRQRMMARVDRMTPGDMPAFEPSMRMALAAFNRVTDAAVKHMILISDGDPAPPGVAILASFRKAGIKISTVAVGAHGPAGHATLQAIATATGGQYYVVNNPRALPRIYQIESRRVARPLVKDLADVPPIIHYPHEILQGIDAPLPPLKGFVMTTVKENPLVEVALVSPDPPTPDSATVLAAWNFGLGRSVAFTSDAGKRWAQAWTEWENYDKFFSQLVRWSMRPVQDDGKYTLATDIRDGTVRVVVTALDKDDQFQNFLRMAATAVDPDLDSFEIDIRQIAPGRYLGEFDADKAGSYFVTISPGPGKAPILAGVNVPYSAEFRDFQTNMPLLENLASLTPQDGQPGQIVSTGLDRSRWDPLLNLDTFRGGLPRAVSRRDVWPIVLLIVAVVFWGDVFIRRVTVHFYWIGPAGRWLVDRVLRRPTEPVVDPRLERLRSRKAAIAEQIDERRAAARFEPQEEETSSPAELDAVLGQTGGTVPQSPPRAAEQPDAPTDRPPSYTARLLEAKKKAWKDKKKEN
jgi:uncharacterized membrane protein/Mg-chelatase subunit ChlD